MLATWVHWHLLLGVMVLAKDREKMDKAVEEQKAWVIGSFMSLVDQQYKSLTTGFSLVLMGYAVTNHASVENALGKLFLLQEMVSLIWTGTLRIVVFHRFISGGCRFPYVL